MDHYEIWCDLKESHKDLQFCENVGRYLGHLRDHGLIEGFTIRRRKLGFGPSTLGEFNITISTKNMAQLEQAFQRVATRGRDIEPMHAAVYSMATNLSFGLMRDFPDVVRVK